jgi:hypothetical protein
VPTKIHFILSIGLLIGTLSSCFKKEEYPFEPIITYDSFSMTADTAQLTFNFTDGNGDIGLSDGDTLPPFNIDSEFHYNLYIDYFEKDDLLGWTEGLDLDGNPIIFKYRIEPINTKGKTKGIKGKMDIDLGNLYYNVLSDQSDTIKYSIQLIDKSLNKSNIIESEEIVR